jgi:DNA-binding MarR family transcriptional regulator
MPEDRAKTLIAVLADATRRAIYELLCRAPHAVGELAAKLPVSRSAVSQHLKVLKDHGLVGDAKAGKQRIYSAITGALSEVAEYASNISKARARPASGERPQELPQPDRIDRVFAQWPGMSGRDLGAVALATRLLVVGRVMEKLLARTCARHGITKVDTIILGTLNRLPPPHESAPTELSKIAVLSPPGITRRLDSLERRKLIVRIAGVEDRRKQIIRLTPRGQRVHEEIARHNFSENYASILNLPADTREQLNHNLRYLLRELEAKLSG